MGDTRFPETAAEKGREWQTFASAKRPRNEYGYDYSLSAVNVDRSEDLGQVERGEYEYDYSFSGVNVDRREDLGQVERGGDRVGFRLLRDRAHHPLAPPLAFLDDHRLWGDQVDAPPFLDHHGPERKRPRYEYEYDCSLSGVNVNRREDLRSAEKGGDRLGFRDRGHSPPPTFLDNHSLRTDQGQGRAPQFLDDRPLLRDRVDAPPSNGLTVSGGPVNFRSDSHRLDPVIEGRLPVDEHYSLPADASSTLFVEGLPSNCTTREAAHIFRHFRGFKEVRIVNKCKEPRKAHGDGERVVNDTVVVLCFVEFDNPKCAATAMASLHGYIFDENDRDSPSLKLQFARSSNARNRDRNGSSFARDRNQDRDERRRRR